MYQAVRLIFWSNPYLSNTNVPLVLGASFSNISTLAWAELDAGAAGGLIGIDELDGRAVLNTEWLLMGLL